MIFVELHDKQIEKKQEKARNEKVVCTCRRVKCNICGMIGKPRHSLNDERRYCASCGRNLGITKCKGKIKK